MSGVILTKNDLEDKGINKYNVSIDTINSSKGYTKDNIQLVGAIVCIDLYNKKIEKTEKFVYYKVIKSLKDTDF